MVEALTRSLAIVLLTACGGADAARDETPVTAPARSNVATRVGGPIQEPPSERESPQERGSPAEDETVVAPYSGPEVVECGCGCCRGAELEVRCVATETELDARRREQHAVRERRRCRTAGCSQGGIAWRLRQPAGCPRDGYQR